METSNIGHRHVRRALGAVVLAGLAVACLMAAMPPGYARAAGGRDIVVGSAKDGRLDPAASGCVSTTDGACTLRAAIEMADAESGDTVHVPSGIYKLDPSLGELAVTSKMTIAGAGAGATVVDGSQKVPVFHVHGGTGDDVVISGLRAQDGVTGIWKVGGFDLTLNQVEVTHNVAGTFTDGHNTAGVLSLGGRLTIRGGTVTDNSGGYAGGIQADTLDLDGTLVANNRSNAVPGIFASGGKIAHAIIQGNGPVPGAADTTSITALSFNSSGTVEVDDSTISGNFGGVWTDSSRLSMVNDTLTENHDSAAVDLSPGGGDTRVDLDHVTIAANTGGGILVETNPGQTMTANVHDSILAGNTAAGKASNCSGLAVRSLGYNIESDATCAFAGTGDLKGTDPRLAPPHQDAGRPTPTMALLPGSPAIDAGDPADQVTTDQRGVARPQGPRSDIGAYELQPQSNQSPGQTGGGQTGPGGQLPLPPNTGTGPSRRR